MKIIRRFPLAFFTIFLLLVLPAACQQPTVSPAATGTAAPEATLSPVLNAEEPAPSAEPAETTPPSADEAPVDEASPTPAVTPTPLPVVVREVPADFNWKELPIQPEINQHAFEIYEHGLSLGRDPNHVSVIGDCQAIPFVFLGRYGLKQYTLSGTDTRLEPMIEVFRDSFAREGAAVRGGFTAAAVLSAVRSDPDLCMPGENPLECEWRIHNPSIAFINLETWREEGTVERYEQYLAKIVEWTLAQGTLPIIIMKADKAEAETHVINPAMARVAYAYDVPIINFWQAVQYIENRGIDPERDGFHLSEEGYHLKETLALRTLYAVWLPYQDQTQATPIPSPTPTMIPTPIAEKPTLEYPAFNCEDNCLYYDLFVQSGNGVIPDGIYEFDLEQMQQARIAEGVALMDVSADQNLFLITRGRELYLLNRTEQTIHLISENLLPYSALNAYFTADQTAIVTLTEGNSANTIMLFDTATFEIIEQVAPKHSPINLLKFADAATVYFEAGTCSALHFCTVQSIHTINTANQQEKQIEGKERLVFSPDGESIAFRDPQYADESNYFHNPLLFHEEVETGITSRRLFSFPHPGGFRVHPEITGYAYSPDGNALFVLQDAYSDYFEKSVGLYFYLEDLESRVVLDYGMLEGAYGSLSPIPVWSEDGEEMVLLLINTINDRDFTLELFRKDMLNRFSAFEPLMEPHDLAGYGYPNHAFWIKESNNGSE